MISIAFEEGEGEFEGVILLALLDEKFLFEDIYHWREREGEREKYKERQI